jgi:hypothetical protein
MVSRQTRSKIEALLREAGPILSRQQPVVIPARVQLALNKAMLKKFGGNSARQID